MLQGSFAMREVFSNQDLALVAYYKSLLDDADILCYIRNENGGNPEVAGATFQPTLCVLTDSDFEAAIALLQSNRAKALAGNDWKCPSCQEENPGSFELCWNCGALAPGQPAA